MLAIIASGEYIHFLKPEFLWGIFGAVMLIFFGISAVLLYHWSAYTKKRERVLFLSGLYFTGAFIIIGGMALSLSLYIHSF